MSANGISVVQSIDEFFSYSFDEEPPSVEKSQITIGGRYCSMSNKLSSIGRSKTNNKSSMRDGVKDEIRFVSIYFLVDTQSRLR